MTTGFARFARRDPGVTLALIADGTGICGLDYAQKTLNGRNSGRYVVSELVESWNKSR